MKKSIRHFIVAILAASSSYHANADDLLTTYQQALNNDPALLKAKAVFLAAEEDIIQTRTLLYPQLSAYGSYGTGSSESFNSSLFDGSTVTTRNTTSSFGLNLSLDLYNHSSWLQLANSKKQAHLSDLSYQIAKQDLIINVTDAYFNVLRAQDDVEFSIAEKQAIERQLEQTKQRFDVGLTDITDVHEAQAQFDNAITSEILAQNSLYNSEESLRELTNVYPHNLNVLNTERFGTSRPLPEDVNEWQQTAEVKSLEIILQKVSVDIAKEDINIAKTGRYPILSLEGSYATDNDDISSEILSFEASGLKSDSIGIRIELPLYSGGKTSSAVRQAQHNFVASSQDLMASHRAVVRRTRNAYNNIIANVSAIKSLEQSVISAESALKATEAGFDVGTRTIVDVLNSTRNLYDAKRNLSSRRYDYIQATLELKRATGVISEQEISDINLGLIAK